MGCKFVYSMLGTAGGMDVCPYAPPRPCVPEQSMEGRQQTKSAMWRREEKWGKEHALLEEKVLF